jgi:hypothetical protein
VKIDKQLYNGNDKVQQFSRLLRVRIFCIGSSIKFDFQSILTSCYHISNQRKKDEKKNFKAELLSFSLTHSHLDLVNHRYAFINED